MPALTSNKKLPKTSASSDASAGTTGKPRVSRSPPSIAWLPEECRSAALAGSVRTIVAATELTVSGISGVHASYLAHGGYDFLIGDGALQYGPEYAWESYYSARLFPGFFSTIDVQHIANPAYNQDRGPVWIYSLRLHIELGLRPLQGKRIGFRYNKISRIGTSSNGKTAASGVAYRGSSPCVPAKLPFIDDLWT